MAYSPAMKAAAEASKGQQRQAEILAVAREILVEGGYDRFVLREIALRAGMTLGNLQYYYRTREALLEALVRAESENDSRTIASISANKESAETQLDELTEALLRSWSSDRGRIYAVTLFLSLSEPMFRAMQRAIYDEFYEHLLPVLKKIDPGARRPMLVARAQLITALWDGALVQLQGGAVGAKAADRARFIDRVREQVLDIARSRRATGRRRKSRG